MFKHYYLKNLRNEQLQKENSEAQLRLLMAQVHPHFMFNTLNNIYSQAQVESPKSAKMIIVITSYSIHYTKLYDNNRYNTAERIIKAMLLKNVLICRIGVFEVFR